MDNTVNISLTKARRLALNAQLLDGRTGLSKGKEGIAQVIERLGYVQIDTISVIERAHHHTLWTRQPDYSPEMLSELQAVDRRIFEYWGHAMSYLPMRDYRFFLPRMKSLQNPTESWAIFCLNKAKDFLKPVMKRIREEGPVTSKDFEPPPGTKSGPWWGWRPAKIALEVLFWRGELMITERRKFQKVYDLTERVLPGHINTDYPDDEELGRYFVRQALSAYGIGSETEIREYIRWVDKGIITSSLNNLFDAGEIIGVTVGRNGKYFVLKEFLDRHGKLGKKNPQIYLVSPFDSLIIRRERTRTLFNFDYALECYVPAAKRKYGYFVLPILWGEEMVGRLDPKAERKKKLLKIVSLYLEDGFSASNDFMDALARKIWDMALFNGCEKVAVEKTKPAKFKSELVKALKKYSG